jgi:hypothetical protein
VLVKHSVAVVRRERFPNAAGTQVLRRSGLPCDPLPDRCFHVDARLNRPRHGERVAISVRLELPPQTAGMAPTTAQTITPASNAPTPGKAPKTRARKAATAEAATTRKSRGAA